MKLGRAWSARLCLWILLAAGKRPFPDWFLELYLLLAVQTLRGILLNKHFICKFSLAVCDNAGDFNSLSFLCPCWFLVVPKNVNYGHFATKSLLSCLHISWLRWNPWLWFMQVRKNVRSHCCVDEPRARLLLPESQSVCCGSKYGFCHETWFMFGSTIWHPVHSVS